MNQKNRIKFLKKLDIGQGTFGEVIKIPHMRDKKIVALKKVFMENENEGVRACFNLSFICSGDHVKTFSIIPPVSTFQNSFITALRE